MKRRLQQLAKKMISMTEQPVFDPATLGDPLALQTQWTPLKGGGTNFKTHKLEETQPGRLEFRASGGSKLFALFFAGMGAFSFVMFQSTLSNGDNVLPWYAIMLPVVVCSVFIIAGLAMFRGGTKPVVFDKNTKYFWKGRQAPHETFNKSEIKDCAELDQIYALQIIREFIRGNKSSYYSYELNLVLKDGKRMNVVDHGNPAALREDAKKLAGWLGCKLWDAG